MGSDATNPVSTPNKEGIQSPIQSPTKPKMFHIPPPAEPVSWSGTRQAALITIAIVFVAYLIHQGIQCRSIIYI